MRSAAPPTPPLPSARPGPLPSRRPGRPRAHCPRRRALPPGVTFTDNGDGTATLSGTPAAGSGGTYPSRSPPRTVSVLTPPSLHPLRSSRRPGSPALPAPPLPSARPGPLPSRRPGCPRPHCPRRGHCRRESRSPTTGTARRHFREHRLRATGGTYPFTITATNGVSPAATQTFTLTVNQACQITSADQRHLYRRPGRDLYRHVDRVAHVRIVRDRQPAVGSHVHGQRGRHGDTFGNTGSSTAACTCSRSSPRTVSVLTTQTFTLTFSRAPGITSADHTTCTVGKACAFTVTSTGVPTPDLSETGALPPGVMFTDNGDGTATLSGTPAAGTGGTYKFTITATNVVGLLTPPSPSPSPSSASRPRRVASKPRAEGRRCR